LGREVLEQRGTREGAGKEGEEQGRCGRRTFQWFRVVMGLLLLALPLLPGSEEKLSM